MSKDTEMSMVEHLEELRRAIIISLVATLVMTVVCLAFADRVLDILLSPVTSTGNEMVYIHVTEALMTKIGISFFLGFLTALPITLWQFWSFMIPALRKTERVYFTLFIVISFVMFIAGILFGFFAVYGLAIRFLLGYGGEELLPMISIGKYVSFTLTFLLPFGLVFELPLAAFFLGQLGILSYRLMIKFRKYALLISVVISAAIVPTPDMITPLLMASPMYLLYEFSAQIIRFIEWRKRKKAKKAEEENEEA
ncbi:twin-arginine translocase subunit TatC [Peptococcaceae bacterium 1198_IL3148]